MNYINKYEGLNEAILSSKHRALGAKRLSAYIKISRDSIEKTAQYLNVPFIEINRCGKTCKVYDANSIDLIIEFIETHDKKERTRLFSPLTQEEWYRRKIEGIKKTQQTICESKADTITATAIKKYFHLSSRVLKNFCQSGHGFLETLNIYPVSYYGDQPRYDPNCINIIKKYFEDNNIDYNNIQEKSEFFREKSILKKYGKTSYMCVEELAEETQNKKNLKEQEFLEKMKEKGIDLVSIGELMKILGKNNSTVNSACQSLNIKAYKSGHSARKFFEKNDVLALQEFFSEKKDGSFMAKKIKRFLMQQNINFSREKTFKNCKNSPSSLLRFDFYLSDLNILVEVQGAHHFKPVCYGGCSYEEALVNYEKQKVNDDIKRQFCKENNIELIEIVNDRDFESFIKLIDSKSKEL